MSEKCEIKIKISVDSTDLDKLEAQLNRIEGLMVNAGLKQPAKGVFIANFDAYHFNPKGCLEPVFTLTSGCTLINEACIEKATLEKVVLQAAKEGAKKGAEQARLEITTGVNDNYEQSAVADDAAGTLDKINEVFHNSDNKAFIAALDKHIDINIPVSHDEFKEFQQRIEGELKQLQSSFISIQNTISDSNKAITESLRQVFAELTAK